MALVNFANLDFDQIKTTIKDYLKSNSDFTDYDFEGSNLSTIIDVLAYNTYITSYNANMVSNEVFIDSATLRENIVSLVQNVGYVPRSARGARLNVSFSVDTTGYGINPQKITLNKGIVATTTQFANESYTFATLDDTTVPVYNNRAIFSNIELIEGIYLKANFTVDAYNPNQRFILPNTGIDTTTIRVAVKPSKNSNTSRKYKQVSRLYEVNSESPIYYVHEIEGERYELLFGDGIFGKKLEAPNYIEVSYIVCNGKIGNGISSATFTGKLTATREGTALTSGISLLTISRSASGGKGIEPLDQIKKFAPHSYSAQQRAVTTDDYETIVPDIYPETDAVTAFGGEELTPPRFGYVYVAIKPDNGSYIPDQLKSNILDELKKYTVAGIQPVIVDLKYLYVEPNVTVYINPNLTDSPKDVLDAVDTNMDSFAEETLNDFGVTFNYSKFGTIIDNADDSITSNITTIAARRDLRPLLNNFVEYEICFGNCIFVENCEGHNIRSSGFTVSGITDVVYLSDQPNPDHRTGTIFLFHLMSPTQIEIVRRNVGTIDYKKGEIKLYPLNITDTVLPVDGGVPVIEIDMIPCSNNVVGEHDLYVSIDTTGDNAGVETRVDTTTTTTTTTTDGDEVTTRGTTVSPTTNTITTTDTNGPATSHGFKNNKLIRGPEHFGCNTDGTVTATATTIAPAAGTTQTTQTTPTAGQAAATTPATTQTTQAAAY